MPETARSGTKGRKKVSWLEEHEPEAAGSTVDPRVGERPDPSPDAEVDEGAVPRVSAPGASGRVSGASAAGLLERLRKNPAPLAFALLTLMVLAVFFWFVFLRSGGASTGPDASSEPSGAASDPATGAGRAPGDPFAGGEVRDTGVVFGAMQVEDGAADLSGAGLEWSGEVAEKEGAGGETITLEGPTAAQLERGFDLGPSSVETGVYAVAQQSGEVLHVTTHSYLPKEEDADAEEITLGTVHALAAGRHTGYAYYRDEREEDSSRVTRTYVVPGGESYRVSYEAPPGTFVPLLVGWQGFGERDPQQQPHEGG